jgi:PqqD family protein of HPr-rel-A system
MQGAVSTTRLLKCWGDEAVVFDSSSGDTHYLKPFTLALYQACREQPGQTLDEIANVLAQRLGVGNTPHFRMLAEDVLHNLRKIGLLESA